MVLQGTLVAGACLVVGLAFLFYTSRAGQPHQASSLLLAWLLVGLAPVFLVFTFFPDSEASGTVQGFTLTGAFAAFAFIWIYGTRQSTRLLKSDRLKADLDAALENLAATRRSAHERSAESAAAVVRGQRTLSYRLRRRRDRRIVLVSGDLLAVRGVDVWVNSENTNMQMSRFYEGTISAIIRYHGARRDDRGAIVEDLIADQLRTAMGGAISVEPGSVLVTGSGELERSNDVRAVLHIAAVVGEPGSGYRRVQDVSRCVIRALDVLESMECTLPMKTILFPLLGTGSGRADIQDTASCMIDAAVEWLESDRSHEVASVYLLAYRVAEVEVCQRLLEQRAELVTEKAPSPRGR